MADGVDVVNITVNHITAGSVGLTVQMEIKCESELDAIGWLVSKLEDQ